ncbi:hypothetical protein MKX03_016623 [Papaver bracteatum]|nr:hypothetical protein MKX03_016623 [Papaver bracteatum]
MRKVSIGRFLSLVRPNGIDRYTFFKGWIFFATDNKLKIGDCVIFELIDRLPDSTFAMNFHICRILENFASIVAVESKVNSFNSPLPSFRISIKPSNNTPVTFARELPTKCGEERMDHVLLQNVECCSWELRARYKGCERYYFSKGWKIFATDNKMNSGDSVLFELIGRLPDAPFVMNFHISRIC